MPDSHQYAAALPPGTKLRGRYLLEECVGRGGFGLVYAARDTEADDQLFAIKEFFPVQHGANRSGVRVVTFDAASRDVFAAGKAAFKREATLLRKLKQENVVRVYEWFEENDTVYMVMDMLAGKTLDAVLQQGGNIDLNRIERWLTGLLKALQDIHAEGIVHCDISPRNIIVTNTDVPVLIDFGAARVSIAKVSLSLAGITNAGYTPIECYGEDGPEAMVPQTDMYSLGATFYEIVTGRRPIAAPSRIPRDRLLPAAEVARDKFPPYVLAGIDHAMQVVSERRWPTAQEWLNCLESKAMPPSNEPVASPAPPPAEPPRKDLRVVAWLAILLLICGVAYQTYQLDIEQSTVRSLRQRLDEALAEKQKLADLADGRQQQVEQLTAEATRAREAQVSAETKAQEMEDAKTKAEAESQDTLTRQMRSDNLLVQERARAAAAPGQFDTLILRNDCTDGIFAAARYQDLSGAWIRAGWWKLDAGQEVRTNMYTRNSTVYYYAEYKGRSGTAATPSGDLTMPIVGLAFIARDEQALAGTGLRNASFPKTKTGSNWGDQRISINCQ